MNKSINQIYSLRVNQLDSQSLDSELNSIIGTKLNNIEFEKLKALVPEFEALIKLYIWWNTIRKNGISVGHSLLQLRYYDLNEANNVKKQLRTKQTYGIAFIQIILPLIKHRIESIADQSIRNAIEYVETFYDTIHFINSLTFLYYGKYRSVWERFLKLGNGLQSTQQNQTSNELQYELMNRELLWHSFAEFLTFILPLINFYRLRNSFLYVFRTYILRSNTNHVSDANQRTLNHLKCCPICNEWPINAHEFGCEHVFCYYCLSSHFLSDQINGFCCPKCLFKSNQIESIKKVKIESF